MVVKINGEELKEFNADGCPDCPMLSLCSGGQFVVSVEQDFDDQLHDFKELFAGLSASVRFDGPDEDSTPSVMEATAKGLSKLRQIRPAEVGKFMQKVVEAQGKSSSDFIQPDDVDIALETVVETYSEFLGAIDADPEIKDLKHMGERVVGFATDGVCRAINYGSDY